jgi:hypothetical protein
MPDKNVMHKCYMPSCKLYVLAGKIMCKRHWEETPIRIRTELVDNYTPGQFESPGLTSGAWIDALREAVQTLEVLAGKF